MSAFAVQNKTTGKFRGVVTQGGSKQGRARLAMWRSEVRDAALVAMDVSELEVARFSGLPLFVEITFRLARPASHFGTGRNAGVLKPTAPAYPIGTPDVDKLARAVLDALKGTAIDDDSRAVDLYPRKRYASAGDPEGARISIRAMASHAAPILSLVPSCMPQGGPKSLGETLGLATTRILRELPILDVKDRIRKATAGTLFAAEASVFAEPKPSHALERHRPDAGELAAKFLEDADDFGGTDL